MITEYNEDHGFMRSKELAFSFEGHEVALEISVLNHNGNAFFNLVDLKCGHPMIIFINDQEYVPRGTHE